MPFRLAKVRFSDSFGERPREEREDYLKAWKEKAYRMGRDFVFKIVETGQLGNGTGEIGLRKRIETKDTQVHVH